MPGVGFEPTRDYVPSDFKIVGDGHVARDVRVLRGFVRCA
jgi:hypothetical protein